MKIKRVLIKDWRVLVKDRKVLIKDWKALTRMCDSCLNPQMICTMHDYVSKQVIMAMRQDQINL